eukprot:Blabericola_migrator_1__8913@NODE_471_length_8214_cov_42_818706_g367_i0_p8_GENE_NODE_471_length_8214_cov_42_818706_g367_i0NODE_471_length_8214_cov_42_818706_g367_i0_p8_ORF_typecomplete_len112_score18_07_NODE_471_length_8214_cov_42_818706_g367_i022362571
MSGGNLIAPNQADQVSVSNYSQAEVDFQVGVVTSSPLPVGNLFFEHTDVPYTPADDGEVPDVMLIEDVAPHVVTWYMAGPCVTVTVTSNHDPQDTETVVLSPAPQGEEDHE